ncbi:MAG: prolyl oligopeptidase family serine peptidase [Bryobacteraceae bacterium]
MRRDIAALYQQQGRVRSISRATLSPDALRVAWSVSGSPAGNQSIYVASVQQPDKAMRITAGQGSRSCNETEPTWSRNGNQLAFLSDCATPGQAQLFIQDLNPDLLQLRQLTRLAGFLSHPQWSPDDEDISLLFVERASRAPTPMAAENRTVGVIDDLRNADVQRLIVANVHSGVTRQVTPASLYVFEYDWSPDAQSFAFIASPPPGDDNWYIAELYTQPRTGPKPISVYKPSLQIAMPRWSPDGRCIAFIQGLMSDQGGTGGEIYTLSVTGGQARDLTPGRLSSPAWYTWLSDEEMLFTEFVGGSTAITRLDVVHGTAKILWQAAETVRSGPEETSLSVSRRGLPLQMALIRTSWSMLPEVWAGPLGNWRQLTHVNVAVDLSLPKFENLSWRSGAFNVQGWLLFPKGYDREKQYPMLVAAHGGPAWIATPNWRAADFNTTLFTKFGYFVFFPNVRGSYGQGERFTQANRRDWGFGDLQDMLAGVNAVLKQYAVDNNRIGILGWSYGGSTAMMAITQTNRFRAAVAGAGAANWQSYYGQNSIDKWMISYFGASVYHDPESYVRCSAITYIKNAKTPTLVLVGERDGEAPPAQSLEFWHALKDLGVPTQLVIYADEGHNFFKQPDRIDVTLRTLEWFDKHMHAR